MEPLSDLSNEVPVHVSQTLAIDPGSMSKVHLVLKVAHRVQGSFRIFRAYGYGDKELKFRVLDATETSQASKPVLDLGIVAGDSSFDFTADKSGSYLLEFDNEPGSSSGRSQKEVQLTYDITNPAARSK